MEECPEKFCFGYRNKLQFPLTKNLETGKIYYGLFMNETHSIVKIDECKVCSKEANYLLFEFIKIANLMDLKIYDEKNFLNGFRYISIRINTNKEAILTIVGTYEYDENNNQIKKIKNLANKIYFTLDDEKIYAKYSNKIKIVGIIYVQNSKKTNFIFGENFYTIVGKDEIIEKFCLSLSLCLDENCDLEKSISYRISSSSFFQINTYIAEKLYQNIRQIIKSFNFEKKPKIVDLYCGSGGIGLFIADLALKIIGIDVVAKSIENAKFAARDNFVYNADYFVGKIEDKNILEKILDEKPDIIILNPPRKGIDEKVIEQIHKIKPKILIYVSCDPVSLARDLKRLFSKNKNIYKLKTVKPFDMFPQTSNVETLALIEKINF
jgi:23S rRNA (uracil1939-C5)-methyltransferase